MLKTMNHLDLQDVNATLISLSKHSKEFWKSPRVTLIRIEALVVLVAIGMLFLVIFGSRRRRSRNFIIQKGVLAAYTFSSSLVTYTFGSMQSSAVKSSMYYIWAISLYVLFGCVDSITAYSLDDNNRATRQFYECNLQYLYVLLIWATVASGSGYYLSVLPFILLLLTARLKFGHRIMALHLASASWKMSKMFADYMLYQEDTNSGSPHNDAVIMRGYHYIVDWIGFSELDAGTSYVAKLGEQAQIIDIEKIWQCENLSSEQRDTCLSFSLFHLLRRRFFRFECAESSLPKTHNFVFKGLLAKDEDDSINYERVFKVIDVELDFMYDFFFTKYAARYFGRSKFIVYGPLVSAILFVPALAVLSARGLPKITNAGGFVILDNTTTDIVITVLILGCITLLEVVQLLYYWTTIWGRVLFACQCVRAPDLNLLSTWRRYFMRFKEVLAKIGVFLSKKFYYEQELGQYSLLDSVSYHPTAAKERSHPILKLLDFVLDPVSHHPTAAKERSYIILKLLDDRALKKLGKPIKLPAIVKEAVLKSLDRSKGTLTNGERSAVNMAPQISWILKHDMHPDQGTNCSQKTENQAHVILVWHIATSYCDMGATSVEAKVKVHREVATILSKYCAYLVVSAPKLLPGHHCDTMCVFEAVAKEVKCVFTAAANKAMELVQAKEAKEAKYKAMRDLPESEEKIFYKGVKLGKGIEVMEDGARWELLAKFWTEMLLYVAPSDNVKEHIECLAKGGEFVTQLWALLTHAGILKRPTGEAARGDGSV